ncbi:hypothetical protein KDK95_17050 [Actinospica sp. MGRD01-02]|uniref:Uncharacterized protein n=1 Tax=Actinospica acidithermotolerans TaxID=2828514 RepID=A0A941IJM5_9ACTN|nr:hypothetical protein [Actinospica acidithermotolerans]MBR7828027.1 hypothetical protein [Actinospica acidithermotolerans]
MSDTENEQRRAAQDVRDIEEAAEHLEQTVDRAREAVRRANDADSMAMPGGSDVVSEAEPARHEDQDPDPDLRRGTRTETETEDR